MAKGFFEALFGDIAALHDAGFGGSDIGRGNATFNAAEAGRLTGSSSSEAARAGHDVRDAMAKDGDMGVSVDRGKK